MSKYSSSKNKTKQKLAMPSFIKYHKSYLYLPDTLFKIWEHFLPIIISFGALAESIRKEHSAFCYRSAMILNKLPNLYLYSPAGQLY